MKTRFAKHVEGAQNNLAYWARAIDRRFFYVTIYDAYFGLTADGWAVTDDFGNLVRVSK